MHFLKLATLLIFIVRKDKLFHALNAQYEKDSDIRVDRRSQTDKARRLKFPCILLHIKRRPQSSRDMRIKWNIIFLI